MRAPCGYWGAAAPVPRVSFAEGIRYSLAWFNAIKDEGKYLFASNEAAFALYRKKGFFEEGARLKKRKFEGRYDDLVCMGLFLKPKNPQLEPILKVSILNELVPAARQILVPSAPVDISSVQEPVG